MKTLPHILTALLVIATIALTCGTAFAAQPQLELVTTYEQAETSTVEYSSRWAMAIGGMGLRLGGVSYIWSGGAMEQAGKHAGLNQSGFVVMPAALNVISHPIMPSAARIEAHGQDQRLRQELGGAGAQAMASTLRDAPGLGLTVGVAF